MHGWMGRILRVDLDEGRWWTESLPEDVARDYLGGRGLGARLLADELPPETDPLDPANRLIFAVGPLTGTPAPTGGRFSLSTLSPLTGCIHDSNAGGSWGVRFKRCGYDALVISGRSNAPCWLFVGDDRVEIGDAREAWGLETDAATDWLRRGGMRLAAAGGEPSRRGPRPGVLCIGPAGEHGVLMAGICVDGRRMLARGGVGAVMGHKNLKGIVALGSRPVTLADPEAFNFVVYESRKLLKANPVTSRGLPQFGTAVLVNLLNTLGALPTRNFTASQFEGARAISGEAMADSILVRRSACWGCPIGCGRVIQGAGSDGGDDEAGRPSDSSGRRQEEGPEYESLWALGADCGIGSLPDVVRANRLCNRLGLDTISTGGTIACAMELAGTGDISGPRFGDAQGQRRLIRDIARREGAGEGLADGSLRFAQRHGADGLAMQVKGLELPAYDPRGLQGQGLAFATSNRGGCHLRANMLTCEGLGLPKMVDRFATGGRAGILIVLQHSHAAIDSLGVCKFAALALGDEHWARLLSAATGLRYTTQDLQRVGERVWTLERVYNLRRGFGAAADRLPERLVDVPISEGPSAGMVVELGPMLSEYYRFRRWDAAGRPAASKLRELGLSMPG